MIKKLKKRFYCGLTRINADKKATLLRTIILVSAILLITIDTGAFREVRKFRAIEFRGLKYLSKYEIIDEINTRVDTDGIVIDMDSLKSKLGGDSMIKAFRIMNEGERIVVAVVENEPAFIIGLRKGKGILLFEIDKEFKVISLRKVHAFDRPLVLISEEDISDGIFSVRMKDFLKLILELEEKNFVLCAEIAEIDVSDYSRARFLLRGRKTKFYLYPDLNNLYRMSYFVSYLDSIHYYPDKLNIYNDLAIMK